MKIKHIEGVTFIEGNYTKDKRALHMAELRLAAALIVGLATITIYAYVFIQFAFASQGFGHHY